MPESVYMDLPSNFFFEKSDPYPTVIAIVKGNALRALYGRHKAALYAWNIRGYLGNQGLNKEIVATVEDRAEEFFYFNNGVAAICTAFKIVENPKNHFRLEAENFQVINGAQTISSLWRAGPAPEVEVLFRLTKTLNVKTEKGFNQDIIRFNNSQNAVKLSDFRSNDDIQVWLEKKLLTTKTQGALPPLHYIRKRAVGRKKAGRGSYGLRLEELAKIRFSFLYSQPELVSSSPKQLWSVDDGGVYVKAFGVDGDLQSAWTTETLQETCLAIAFYLYIDQKMKELGEKDEKLKFLRRMRWLALSLAGWYVRQKEVASDVYLKPARFEEVAESFWSEARRVLVSGHMRAVRDEVSLFALVRATDRWEAMKDEFELQVLAQDE